MKKIVIMQDENRVVDGEISNVTLSEIAQMMGTFARSVCQQKELVTEGSAESAVVRVFAMVMLQAMGVNVNTELDVEMEE